MKKLFLVYLLLFTGFSAVIAQVTPSPAQMQEMKVDNLTDDQIRQLVEEMKKNGIRMEQLHIYAREKGVPSSEVSKLRMRINELNLTKEFNYAPPSASQEIGRGVDMENMTTESAGKTQRLQSASASRIFGSELFNNNNLTFEPNLRMPTPPNYRLAAGDEVVIDVYGFSEVQHKVSVSPEGYIRIPYVGPVYVNGLTMEEAKNRITKQLGSVYGGIKSGNTFVQVSLGTIRSIQVLMIGEVVRPGTYTLPSLASIANALYVSGGPDNNGSFRDIQLIRNGSTIARFDLYDFLTRGDLTNNMILQDQDIVKVNPYRVRIELDGQVKRPGIFEAKDGETLQTIIDYAGGYTDNAYRSVIRSSRITNKEREMKNVQVDQANSYSLQSGDKFFVDAILDRFTNRVSITGAIFHPGDYQLENGMTLSGLIKKADGLMEVASLSRGIIRRMKEDYTPSILSFNVEDVVTGRNDIVLQREDSVVVYSKLQLREKYQVKIDGLVNNSGYFDFADSMKLEDLILMAGGLKDAASLKRVEISRRIRGREFSPSDTQIAIVQQFDIREDLRSAPEAAEFQLLPFDQVFIRKSPTYTEQASVSIDGEVLYPGGYTINSNRERISDLLRRSGGLKPGAYAEGAVLLRKTFNNESDSVLLSYKLDVFSSKLRDSSAVYRLEETVMRREQMLGINLPDILRSPGSKYDLFLEEGDKLKIPKKLQSVQLYGEIYFPKKVRFDKSVRFRDYVRGAGGFTSNALRRRSYVVYANGEVKSTKKVLFFNAYPKVKPGSEIYVPKKGDKRGFNTQEAVGITTGIASLALIIYTILNKN